MNWIKRLFRWLGKRNKPKQPIIRDETVAPMNFVDAMTEAYNGSKVVRFGEWVHKGKYVESDPESKEFVCGGKPYIPHPADKVSCDWVKVKIGTIIILLLAGCTDRISYKHSQDPDRISVNYTEGVGNSQKTAIEVVLSDGSRLTIGNSTTDQEQLIQAVQEISQLMARMAMAFEGI